MKNLIQAAVVSLFAASAAQAQQAVQWRASDGGNGHWYSLMSGSMCQPEFSQRAAAIGAHLATISSSGESDFVHGLINVGSGYWTYIGWEQNLGSSGFSEPGGGWGWVNGEPVTYVGWGANEPNNGGSTGIAENHAIMFPGLSYWVDVRECVADQAVIEYSADCNNDGIVDYGQILQGEFSDANPDGVPDVCQQPTCADADLFCDFNVNGADLGILLSQWGPSSPLTVSDINSDGVVNGADLGLLLSFWGACP